MHYVSKQFWNYLLLLSCWFGSSIAAYGQEIKFSRPQRLPSKVTDYEILGKINDKILLYKWGNHHFLLDRFNTNDLSLASTSLILLGSKKEKQEIINIFIAENQLCIFYVAKHGRKHVAYLQTTDVALKPISEPIPLDTIQTGFLDNSYLNYSVQVSPDKSYFMLLCPPEDNRGQVQRSVIVQRQNTTYKVLAKPTFILPEKHTYHSSLLDHNGNAYLVSVDYNSAIIGAAQIAQLAVLHWQPPQSQIHTDILSFDERRLNQLSTVLDYKNHQLILSGLYATGKQSTRTEGYGLATYNPTTHALSTFTQELFTDSFLKKLSPINRALINTGTEAAYHLRIRQLLVRNNGGVLLLGEVAYSTQTNLPNSYFDNFYPRVANTYTNYYYGDMIALSIAPDAHLEWSSVLPKKQASEQDSGYFSSFGTVNGKQKLNLVFNEAITYDTSLNAYLLQANGEFTINSVASLAEYKVMVAPQYGKQLSENEWVAPAFNQRNELLLLKATF